MDADLPPADEDRSAHLGLGEPFPFAGGWYDLARLDARGEADMERWLKQRAWAALGEVRAGAPRHYEDAYRLTLAQLGAGFFRYGSPAFEEAVATRDGLAQFVYLSLRRNRPDATPDLALRMADECGDELWDVLALANGWGRGRGGKGGGRGLTFREAVCVLQREPFNKSLDEVGRMDRFQISTLLSFDPETLAHTPAAGAVAGKKALREGLKAQGVTDEAEVERLWAEPPPDKPMTPAEAVALVREHDRRLAALQNG